MSATDIHSELTAERVREIFSYDPETGELRWKIVSKPRLVGRKAGCKNQNGYFRVKVGARLYLVHRIAWLHFYGKWPVNHLDHRNGITDDNRIVNLRDVSRQVNMQNRHKAQSNNLSTGVLGTYFDRRRQLFIAAITVPITGCKYLGGYSTVEEASQVYLEARRRLHEGNTI